MGATHHWNQTAASMMRILDLLAWRFKRSSEPSAVSNPRPASGDRWPSAFIRVHLRFHSLSVDLSVPSVSPWLVLCRSRGAWANCARFAGAC